MILAPWQFGAGWVGSPPGAGHSGPIHPVRSQPPARWQVIFHYVVKHFPARCFHYSDGRVSWLFSSCHAPWTWKGLTCLIGHSKALCGLKAWLHLAVALLWSWTPFISSTPSLPRFPPVSLCPASWLSYVAIVVTMRGTTMSPYHMALRMLLNPRVRPEVFTAEDMHGAWRSWDLNPRGLLNPYI